MPLTVASTAATDYARECPSEHAADV